MVTVAQTAIGLPIPHQPLPVGENKVQDSTFSCWLLCHLEKEVVTLPLIQIHNLSWVLIYPQAELHPLQQALDIEQRAALPL